MLKFLLIAVLVYLVVAWLRRGLGSAARRSVRPAPEPVATPQPMLRCLECGLHLPRDDALPGRAGVFCGAAHRTAYEQAHPAPP